MLPGDVLLVTGTSKFSATLAAGQKTLYLKAKSSHVELSLGDGIFIHSTNDGGVHLSLLIDELKDCGPDWRVIRHKTIQKMGEETESLQKAGMYFFSQEYNKFYMGPGNEHSSFCSELVAKAYQRAGIEILGGKLPSKVAPAHFDEEADRLENWLDVTAEYMKILNDMAEDDKPYRLAAFTLTAAMMRRRMNTGIREMLYSRLESRGEKEKAIVDKARKNLRENRELDFWYAKDS